MICVEHSAGANVLGWSAILVQLLRTRQAATHFSLLNEVIDVRELAQNVECDLKEEELKNFLVLLLFVLSHRDAM